MGFKGKSLIDNLGKIITGKTPSTKNSEYWNGNIPFITPKDLQGSKHIISTERKITKLGAATVKGSIIPINSVCVSCIGVIGYVGITTEESVSNQQINSIIVNENNDTDYVYYLMKWLWPYFKNYEGQSTTLSILNKTHFSKIEIPIYPLDYQRKVSKLLSMIDDKIELNQQINKNLEEQAQAIYKSIAAGTIDKKPLSDFITIKHGYAFEGKFIHSIDNNIVLVTPGNFRIGGGFQENKCKYFSAEYPEDYILQPGNLIVTMTDLSRDADTLGYGALVPDNPHRIYLHNQRIGLVEIFNDLLIKDYIYWYMRSYEYHNLIVGSSSGSTVKHTSPKRILEMEIPIPSAKDKNKLNILIYLDSLISFNDTVNIQLVNLRDALLPRLMSGEIDVSGIDC